MKFSKQLANISSLFTLALVAGACLILPANLHAADHSTTQRMFSTPDDAIKALQAAAESKDKAALRVIFGPEFNDLLTGDAVEDANNQKKFASVLAQGCKPVTESETKITLEIGTNNWPMPIPLVKADGQWHFDTAAGKQEIINRHVGEGELHAIGVCRAYVAAQRQYASMNPDPEDGEKYARKFKSSAGKKDGLYWPASDNGTVSPFGPLVAEAHAEGYASHKGSGMHPFHGYYFKILTQQGKDAPGGKMSYLTHGKLTEGFALVAYPERWDESGIMTFIVNQEGKVYERNFGEKTARIAGSMKEYNPDSEWHLVQDEGIMNAAAEK